MNEKLRPVGKIDDLEQIKDCPFCGCKLSEFPVIMVVHPYRSEEYLMLKLKKGHFLGNENGYVVDCIRCGACGGVEITPELAIQKWNRRTDNGQKGND